MSIHFSPARRSLRRGWSRPVRLPLRLEGLEQRDVPSFTFPLSGTTWLETGPRNIAAVRPGEGTTTPGDLNATGRIVDLAAHPTDPDIFYAATAGGGVAKTMDGGDTWVHQTQRLPDTTPGLTDDLRTLSMGAIALSRIDPNIVYAGEGEPDNSGDSYTGNGILKSLDGGVTWQLITGPGGAFINSHIAQIVTVPNPAAPTDASQELVFVCIQRSPNGAGLWRSKDGGNSWALISSRLNADNLPDPIPTFHAYTDIAVDPSNPEIVYVAIGEHIFIPHLFNGVYKTTHALSDTPAAPGANGTEWKVVFGGNGSFVVSGALIQRTRIALAESSPSTMYIDIGPTSGMWRTTNGGTDWQKFATTAEGGNVPAFGNNPYSIAIAVDPTDRNRVAVAGTAVVLYTENALSSDPITLEPNATWSQIQIDPQGQGPHVDHHAFAFGPLVAGNPRRQILNGNDGGVFKTQAITPGGNGTFSVDWVSANGIPGPFALDVVQYVGLGLHPTSPDLYIGGTQDNGALKFTDDGTTMQSVDLQGNPITVTRAYYAPEVNGGDVGEVIYDFINPNNVYSISPVASFGTANFIQKSTNGGTTWAAAATGITNPNATLFYPPMIMDPSQSNRLFVGTDAVNETTDRAASWHNFHGKNLPFVTGLDVVDGGPKPVVTAMGMSRSNPAILYVSVLNRAFGSPLVSWGPAIYQLDTRRDPLQNGEAGWHDISPFNLPLNGGPSTPRGVDLGFNNLFSYPGLIMPPITGAPPEPQPNDFAFFETITALTVDPFDWRIVYATSDNRRVMKTTDGGVTWQRMSDAGIPNGPTQQTFQDVVIDPNLLTANGQVDDDLYIATNVGVYKLTNPTEPFANQQWVRLGDVPYDVPFPNGDPGSTPGFQPDVRVEDLEINTSLGILASASHGRGIWQFSIRPYIAGIVFEDVNGDGVDIAPVLNGPDPEPALTGVRVVATDITPSHPGTPFEAANTTTDSKGFYVFRSLENGTYTVRPSDLSVSGKETLASLNPVDTTTKYQITTPPRQYTVDQRFTEPNAHIGLFDRTSISGVKFDDTNGNGVRDAGEPGLGSWVLQLLRSDNNQLLDTTTTAADGSYTFDGLGRIQDTTGSVVDPLTGFPVPGYKAVPFRVREVLQAGWVQTSFNPADITLTSNTPVAGVDFGNFKLVSIAGTVYEDVNGNGVFNAGEPGLSGWEVKIFNVTNLSTPVFTTTTGAGGTYTFANLGPGTFRVRETVQPTWKQTSLNPADIPATSGKNVAGIDFGNFRAGGFTGVAFEDVNGNGVRDGGETTVVPGATVALFDGGSGKLLATTLTNSTGVYTFTGLFPLSQGNTTPYRATIVAPSNFAQTTLDQLVTVQSNTVLTGRDLGLFKRTSISGFAFEDINGNGVQDAGDPAIVNGSVALLNAATKSVVTTTTTDANGAFTFTDLGPIQSPPGGPQVGYLVAGDPNGFVQTTPSTGPIFIQSGIPTGGIQIGLFRLVNFTGQAFTDVDGNGVLDVGEPGLGGQTVQLVNATTGAVVQSTVTNAGGFFSLPAGPGTFTLREVAAAGSVITTPLPGNTTTTSGLVVPPTLFGNFQLVSVAGLVFNDRNGNGVFDTNDQRLNGWAVQLVRLSDGAVLATQVTPSAGKTNGEYFFANVGPGTYRVQEVVQPPFVPSITSSVDFAARSGQNLTVNFGNFAPAAASGRVFEDLDSSGKLDGSEVGVAGFTVDILNSTGVVISTGITDAAGRYTATGLPPGTYTAVLNAPAGWVRTNPDPAAFPVQSGDTFAVADLGVLRLGSMAGAVFLDSNRNGKREGFEHGIPGAVVALLNGTGAQVATILVGADGSYQFLNLQPGTYTTKLLTLPPGFTLSGSKATGQYTADVSTGSTSANNNLTGLDFGMIGRKRYALAADGGGGPRVQVYDAVDGSLLKDFFVYEPTFTGGVRVATGDVTGDGIDDLATVAGPGGGPRLRVIDGVTGAELYNFFTYEPSFRDGLYVALGDVNGDGFADMITGTSPGGGARVTVYSGRDGSQIDDYFAYDSSFRGGVRVAAGDTDGDGVAEVITGPGNGGIPFVIVWGNTGVPGAHLAPRLSFPAFDPGYLGGVFVGSGPVGPSGRADVLVGSGQNYPGTPVLRSFNGTTGDFQIEVPAFDPFIDGTPYQSEVRVTSFDRNGDNVPDYVIASGPGSPPRIRFLDGRNRRQIGAELNPFETTFVGGLYVG